MTQITMEEWLSALESESELGLSPDAKTINQWALVLYGDNSNSAPRIKASKWVRAGIENGWMVRATVVIDTLPGISRRCVGFRLVKKEEK